MYVNEFCYHQRVSVFLSFEQKNELEIKSLETVPKDLSVNNKSLTFSYTLFKTLRGYKTVL